MARGPRGGTASPVRCADDVDVVGTPDRDEVYDALDGIDSALGREVNVTFVSPERWASGAETFLAAIHSRPMVPLRLDRPDATVG